jgi:hypothetical protein
MRICSIERHPTSSSFGLATTYARHFARDTATLRRLRESKNSRLRGTSAALEVAIERLTAAVEAERELGYLYDAACLELDLARALEAHGDADAAEETRERAASVLAPLGCVNAF